MISPSRHVVLYAIVYLSNTEDSASLRRNYTQVWTPDAAIQAHCTVMILGMKGQEACIRSLSRLDFVSLLPNLCTRQEDADRAWDALDLIIRYDTVGVDWP